MRPRVVRRLLILAVLARALLCGCHVLAVPLATTLFRPPRGDRTPADAGLDFRDLELRGSGGAVLPAWLVPARPGPAPRGLVLLLAENGGTRASPRMLRLAAVVAAQGFDALLLDLRGHGDSGGINTYGLGETEDLLRVLDTLTREAPSRRLVAVGFSLGAACILRAMSVNDHLAAAVVFAPYARLDAALLRHELEYQTQGRPLASAASRLLSARLLLASLRLWAGFPDLPEPEDLVTERPVLLFHALGDPEIPYQDARDILARARAPALEHKPVERDVHLPSIVDTEVWATFEAELSRLLDRVLPAPPP